LAALVDWSAHSDLTIVDIIASAVGTTTLKGRNRRLIVWRAGCCSNAHDDNIAGLEPP